MNVLKIFRRRIAFIIIYALLSAGLLVLVSNNESLYREPVAAVRAVEEESYGEEEYQGTETFMQTLTVEVLNGEYQGETFELQNLYSSSQTVDESYHKGDRLILSITQTEDGITGDIVSLKRDTVIVFMLLVLIFVVLLFIKGKGIFTLISVAVNMLLLYVSLGYMNRGQHTVIFAVFLMVAFMVISLLVSGGFHKSTLASIIASACTVFFTAAIYLIVMKCTGEPEYFMMDYVEYLPNSQIVPKLFFAEIMIGSLGAVMDVAISITSTVRELTLQNPGIPVPSLYAAVKQVGYDIMGTMINVMFFSYFCGTIPMILMKMQNDYGFSEIFRYHLPFEVIRFLTGSIGIVLAIPVSSVAAILILAGGRKDRRRTEVDRTENDGTENDRTDLSVTEKEMQCERGHIR